MRKYITIILNFRKINYFNSLKHVIELFWITNNIILDS